MKQEKITHPIALYRTKSPKAMPEEEALVFGKYFTDHMFMMEWTEQKGWHDSRILPHGPLLIDPASMALHYGQAVFEGLKAFRDSEMEVRLFRPEDHMLRLLQSCRKMRIPEIDASFGVSALKALLRVDIDWVPKSEGTSMYLRPLIFASEAHLGVRASKEYIFIITASPVPFYFPKGFHPIRIMVADQLSRTSPGGIGSAKTPANYAASLMATEKAKEKGFHQVLWLDGCQHRWVEEVGTMNIFFKIGDRLITPSLDRGTILPGITRKSVIQLARDMGIQVEERDIAIEEVVKAHRENQLKEVFGTGTAAAIAPIGLLHWKGEDMIIHHEETGDLTQALYKHLTDIQYGQRKDSHQWMTALDIPE